MLLEVLLFCWQVCLAEKYWLKSGDVQNTENLDLIFYPHQPNLLAATVQDFYSMLFFFQRDKS